MTNVDVARARQVWSAVNIDYLTETCAVLMDGPTHGQSRQQGLFMRTGKGVGAW